MKKIVGIIFLLGLVAALVTTVSAAPDLNGSWSGFGYYFKAQQSGNSITIIATDGDIKGKVSLEGAITGNTVEGRQILIAKGCPNLEKYVPARGTISPDGNSINITYKNLEFDPGKCVDLPGNEFTETGSYTKVSSPSTPTTPFQPTQTPQVEKEAGRQTQQPAGVKQPKPSDSPALLSEDKENLFKKALGGFPVFIGEWSKAISTGMDLREFFAGLRVGADEYFTDDEILIWEEGKKQDELKKLDSKLNDEALWQFGVDPKEIFERKPKVTWVDTDKLRRQKDQPDSPFKLDILNGQAQIKYPGESGWRDVAVGDKIPPGSTIFTGMDTTTVLSIKGKGVVQILPFTEVTITEKGLADPSKTTTDIDLRTGEIELNVEGGVYTSGSSVNINAAYTTSSVRGTHFWVRHDDKKKVDIIGVYEGKVEVKTKDGKVTTIIPDGEKPGVVVVSQKLSPIKLAIAGVVLAAVIGGVVLILKMKFTGKGSNKKKK